MFSVIKERRFNSDLLSMPQEIHCIQRETHFVSRSFSPARSFRRRLFVRQQHTEAERCLTFAEQKAAASRLLSSRTTAECANKNKYLCTPAQRRRKRHIDKIPDSSIVTKTQLKVFLRRGFRLSLFLFGFPPEETCKTTRRKCLPPAL
jgi:hypothetical protein